MKDSQGLATECQARDEFVRRTSGGALTAGLRPFSNRIDISAPWPVARLFTTLQKTACTALVANNTIHERIPVQMNATVISVVVDHHHFGFLSLSLERSLECSPILASTFARAASGPVCA